MRPRRKRLAQGSDRAPHDRPPAPQLSAAARSSARPELRCRKSPTIAGVERMTRQLQPASAPYLRHCAYLLPSLSHLKGNQVSLHERLRHPILGLPQSLHSSRALFLSATRAMKIGSKRTSCSLWPRLPQQQQHTVDVARSLRGCCCLDHRPGVPLPSSRAIRAATLDRPCLDTVVFLSLPSSECVSLSPTLFGTIRRCGLYSRGTHRLMRVRPGYHAVFGAPWINLVIRPRHHTSSLACLLSPAGWTRSASAGTICNRRALVLRVKHVVFNSFFLHGHSLPACHERFEIRFAASRLEIL